MLTPGWINPLRRRSAPAKSLIERKFHQRIIKNKKRALSKRWARLPGR